MGALAKAMKNGVNGMAEGTTKRALGEAIGKIERTEKKKNAVMANVVNTGHEVAKSGIRLGTTFTGSYLEGRYGDKVARPGGVPVRGVAAVPLYLVGGYFMLSGERGGEYATALADGLAASEVASVGVRAGRNMADKAAAKGGAAQPQVAGAQPQVAGPTSGNTREIALTPEPSVEGRGRGGRRRRRLADARRRR